VAKCLFASKRARPDIILPVAFLTTRVKSPDTDDWKKLTRAIRYLRGTIELPLILRADSAYICRQTRASNEQENPARARARAYTEFKRLTPPMQIASVHERTHIQNLSA